MSPDPLNEREFELVNIVGAELGANQRDLSRLMNLSLGMVNMLLRRLITKGYIRIEQLNKKKANYLLTPKGFSEKTRKSVQYTLKTINSISLIQNRLRDLVAGLVERGVREFFILGRSDFASLVVMVIETTVKKGYRITFISENFSDIGRKTVLVCKELEDHQVPVGPNVIDLIHELSKDERLVAHAV
jgi:DNA-binding MarR family transcriptional regulator